MQHLEMMFTAPLLITALPKIHLQCPAMVVLIKTESSLSFGSKLRGGKHSYPVPSTPLKEVYLHNLLSRDISLVFTCAPALSF